MAHTKTVENYDVAEMRDPLGHAATVAFHEGKRLCLVGLTPRDTPDSTHPLVRAAWAGWLEELHDWRDVTFGPN